MSADSEIRKKYEFLYRGLKSEGIDYLERSRIPEDVKQDIIKLIRNLPHPKVASIFDVKDVCRECSAGRLEYLFELFGRDARLLLQQIQEAYPDEQREEVSLPPVVQAEEADIQDVAEMVKWSNETLLRSYLMLKQISGATDIILKAQCPYCMGDLVEVIVGHELRLRCKSQTKSHCRSVDWSLGTVQKRHPPP